MILGYGALESIVLAVVIRFFDAIPVDVTAAKKPGLSSGPGNVMRTAKGLVSGLRRRVLGIYL